MVGTNKSLPSNDGTYLRKIRKPLIEKKRRERMNQSITQLRDLIDDTIKQSVAPMTRVDKADILELTVCHLTKLRHQKPVTTTTYKSMSYAAGFQDCAHHVTSFLISNGLLDGSRLQELNKHLHLSASGGPNTVAPILSHTSTPYRAYPASTDPTNVPAFRVSPIQYSSVKSPEGRLSFSEESFMSFSDSPRSDFSSEDKSSSPSSAQNQSAEDVSVSSLVDSPPHHVKEERRTVRIGTGSEDMIGHMIQETTWRPWN